MQIPSNIWELKECDSYRQQQGYSLLEDRSLLLGFSQGVPLDGCFSIGFNIITHKLASLKN